MKRVALPKEQEMEAERIALALLRLGIQPVTEGSWTVYKPPPPPELLMRIMDLPHSEMLERAFQRLQSQGRGRITGRGVNSETAEGTPGMGEGQMKKK